MRLLRNILLGIVLIIVVLVVIGGVIVNRWMYGPLPQHDGTLTVAGLSDTVEVIRDEYGVPHIYASNVHDLRFAQGFVQAQDRWWQMEFGRHLGSGTLQELTGQTDSLMGYDVFIRTVGWRRAAENDYANLDADMVAELQAFADGVNAYILNRPASELAFEYSILGITGVDIPIEAWTPVDTLVWTKVMAWDLSGNRSEELLRSELASVLDDAMIDDYMVGFPFGEKPTVIQPEDIPEAGSPFAPPMDTAGIRGIQTQLAGNVDMTHALLVSDGIGSNNWVVSGDLTESGLPLLADDPHLGIQMPSIWYEVGLHCQPVTAECSDDVRGFAFPASMGVIIGHNANIAWGVTNNGWDTQDLYRITVNPDNPLQYEYNGEWRDMTLHEEVIRFGDSDEAITLRVRETHFGPIINDNEIDEETGEILGYEEENPLAMRWTAYESSTLVNAIVGLNRASNWDEFHEALSYWDTPSQNFVYADIEGNIGYQTPSRIPVRAAGHTGSLPVDGSTDEYEWRGYVPYEYLPSVQNPERGYIATANQALVPLEYYEYLRGELADEFGEDAHYVFGYSWALGYRGQRIVEMLQATDQHTLDTFREIHADNKFIAAEEIAPYLGDLDMGNAELNELRDWMLDWDYQLHMDSPQAALFMNFWLKLMLYTYEDQLGDTATPSGASLNMWGTNLLMQDPENIWWDNTQTESSVESRDDIIALAFSDGYRSTVALLGEDRTAWKWGDLHTSTFVSNPLGLSGISLIEDMVNYGPVPTSGGAATVNATRWTGLNNFEVATLPSMRMVVDLSNLDNSHTVHTSGQSGHPFSGQYTDMVDDWRLINYHPMYWSRDDVEANAANTLTLQPE